MENLFDTNSSLASTLRNMRSQGGNGVEEESAEMCGSHYVPGIDLTSSITGSRPVASIPSPAQVLGVFSSLPVKQVYVSGNSESSANELNESAIKSETSMARHQDEHSYQIKASLDYLSIENEELKHQISVLKQQKLKVAELKKKYDKLLVKHEQVCKQKEQLLEKLSSEEDMNQKLRKNEELLIEEVQMLKDRLEKSNLQSRKDQNRSSRWSMKE